MKINITKLEITGQELRKIKLKNLEGVDISIPFKYSFNIDFDDNEKIEDFILFCSSITKDFIRDEEFEIGGNKVVLKYTDKKIVDKLIKMNELIYLKIMKYKNWYKIKSKIF